MLFVARTGGLTRRHATQAAGYAAVAIAATTLIGMWTGLPLLSTWGFGFPTIRPVAAVGLAALGLALMHPGKDSHVALEHDCRLGHRSLYWPTRGDETLEHLIQAPHFIAFAAQVVLDGPRLSRSGHRDHDESSGGVVVTDDIRRTVTSARI